MEEIEVLLVSFGPVVCQRRQGRRELTDNGIHESVAGRLDVVLTRQSTDLAVDERNAQWRSLQGQAFDALVQHEGQPTVRAPIAAWGADEPGQAHRPVALHPSAEGAERVRVLAGEVCERGVLFQKRP